MMMARRWKIVPGKLIGKSDALECSVQRALLYHRPDIVAEMVTEVENALGTNRSRRGGAVVCVKGPHTHMELESRIHW